MAPSQHAAASYDAQAFAELAEELHQAGDLGRTAEQVIDTAVDVLDADRASITMMVDARRLETIAPTDQVVVQLDQLQYELREGPCFDTTWQRRTLLVPDLANDNRWPLWAPKAASNGVSSMMSVELGTTDRRIGALNLYFAEFRTFTHDDIAFASIFARHASLAVVNETTTAQLHLALDSRKLIGQAQGILMERFDLSDMQAFEVLKRYSTNSNVKLRLVAERVVATRKLPDGQTQTK